MIQRAFCNELFSSLPFPRFCDMLASNGFHGTELDPATCFEQVDSATPRELTRVRNALNSAGITFVGFHWLLRHPPGLSLFAENQELRDRSWRRLDHLSALCLELGGAVLVIGSGPQRRINSTPLQDAVHYTADRLSQLGEKYPGVRYCVEPLPPGRTDFLTSLEQVSELLQLCSGSVGAVFDFRNASSEERTHHELLHRYMSCIRHVHLNELDGCAPTGRGMNFRTAADLLHRGDYSGWVSVEPFHLVDSMAETVAGTARYLDEAGL